MTIFATAAIVRDFIGMSARPMPWSMLMTGWLTAMTKARMPYIAMIGAVMVTLSLLPYSITSSGCATAAMPKPMGSEISMDRRTTDSALDLTSL